MRLDQIPEGEIIQQKTNDHVSDCDEIKHKSVETDHEEDIISFCERVEGDSTEVEVPVPRRSLRILNKEMNLNVHDHEICEVHVPKSHKSDAEVVKAKQDDLEK